MPPVLWFPVTYLDGCGEGRQGIRRRDSLGEHTAQGVGDGHAFCAERSRVLEHYLQRVWDQNHRPSGTHCLCLAFDAAKDQAVRQCELEGL